MTKRNREKEFVTAFSKELEACGLPSDQETQTLFRSLAEGRLPKKARITNENEAFSLGALATIAEGIRRAAKNRKFKTETELNEALEEVRGFRYKMRPAIAEILTNMKALLPRKKRGPQSSLTDSQKQAACSTINTLKDNGMTVTFAIEQTAKSYKVSNRMIRSVWESHGRS
jgi:uncharacterized protein YoaH (UPF0181 family)